MRLSDFVTQELVFVGLKASNLENLFEQLLEKVCEINTSLDKDTCLKLLLERERQYGTGLEHGTAVPHAMVPGLDKTLCVVATLAEPLDFGSADASLVRIVFLLLSPHESVTNHIRVLARIARFCSIPSFLERVLQAKDAKSLYRVILEEDQRHV